MRKIFDQLTPKKVAMGLGLFLLMFSVVSLVIVVNTYNSQFPRYERHDDTITATLQYASLENDYPRDLVKFYSGENLLQGYLYDSDYDRGLVVVAHGIGGGADSYLPQIKYFLDQGWRVFAYDATGSFDSGGKSTKGFPQSILDLQAALRYIKTQEALADMPLLLFGHSWGGYAVANALHFDYEIAGVVSVSGANSAMEMVIEQGEQMMGSFIHVQYPFLWLYQRLLFGETASLTAVDAINKTETPVLIIHGTEDEMVQFEGSSILSKKELFTNPNVHILPVSEPGQNGHNSLFKSKASQAYIEEVNKTYLTLYDAHDQEIPYEIKQTFYATLDRSLAQDLDPELMATINAFFLECIK